MKNPVKFWIILFALVMAACQNDGSNEPDDLIAPILKTPATGATDVSFMPTFTWETSGDDAVYTLYLSDNKGKTWTTVAEDLKATTYTLTEEQELDHETAYDWKVMAMLDGSGSESSVFSFTTLAEQSELQFPDGKTYLYLDSPKAHPLNIVITGEGFIQEDYESGFFDEKVDEMMEVFFKVEPYKAYKEYFEVHKLVSVSKERGVTVDGARPERPPLRPSIPKQTVDTKFGLLFSGGMGTGISITNKWGVVPVQGIYDYIRDYFPNIDDESWNTTIIFIVVNINAYGGTSHPIPTTGQAVAITPLCALPGGGTHFGILIHESGHAIGCLADEYYGGSKTIPQSEIDRSEKIRNGDPWRYDANIDYTGNRESVHWAKYYDMEGYDDVDYVEGGNLYPRGVWRSTADERSLMKQDYSTLWFNTVCREATVRRLMSIAGETFVWEDFLAKDVNTPPVLSTVPYSGPSIPLLECR